MAASTSTQNRHTRPSRRTCGGRVGIRCCLDCEAAAPVPVSRPAVFGLHRSGSGRAGASDRGSHRGGLGPAVAGRGLAHARGRGRLQHPALPVGPGVGRPARSGPAGGDPPLGEALDEVFNDPIVLSETDGPALTIWSAARAGTTIADAADRFGTFAGLIDGDVDAVLVSLGMDSEDEDVAAALNRLLDEIDEDLPVLVLVGPEDLTSPA